MPILSFSIPEHMPLIKAGIRQANGKQVAGRVKRQTIRRYNGENSRYLAIFDENPVFNKPKLHLWWKSRRPEREKLGTVRIKGLAPLIISNNKIRIMRDESVSPFGKLADQSTIDRIAYDDGFNSTNEFFEFFSKQPGEEYFLIRW